MMSCKKYNLTNTGSLITTFNYQSCSDTQWRYNVNLYPGQSKSVWALNNTFQVPEYFLSTVIVENQGDYLEFVWASLTGSVSSLQHLAAQTTPVLIPEVPSLIITVTQI